MASPARLPLGPKRVVLEKKDEQKIVQLDLESGRGRLRGFGGTKWTAFQCKNTVQEFVQEFVAHGFTVVSWPSDTLFAWVKLYVHR